MLSAKMLDKIHQEILKWYELYGRKNLPWRNLEGNDAPYKVYVSEIMLQQTQVATILAKYYEPFLKAFPTLEALSLADEDEVLLMWRGLGYYSRARNMLKTAQICGKSLPQDPKDLIKLPGIGEYTAGAIACFGFKKAVSFVDGNIKRVLSRFFALSSPTMRELQKYAQSLLNKTDCFNHNQALLDIGATLCTPTAPKCDLCPLQAFCQGKDNPDLYTQRSKVVYEALQWDLGVWIVQDKIALKKANASFYKGMYNFPKIQSEGLLDLPFIGSLKHSHTRYRLSLNIYLIKNEDKIEKDTEFFNPKDIASLPISALTLKVLELLRQKGFFNYKLT